MKNTPTPVYMVLLNENYPLKTLNKNHDILGHTRIEWAFYKSKREVQQCRRCQEWRHVAANCNAPYKCVKCGDNHSTHLCTKSRDTPATCANCGDEHTANSVICEFYIKAVASKTQRRQATNPAIKQTQTIASVTQLNARNFPALRAKATPSHQPSAPPAPLEPPAPTTTQHTRGWENQRPEPTTNQVNGTSEIEELMNEVNKLHQLVNISEMLSLVKQLNQKLANAKSKSEKFDIFISLKQNING
jgi:hypothetical protein